MGFVETENKKNVMQAFWKGQVFLKNSSDIPEELQRLNYSDNLKFTFNRSRKNNSVKNVSKAYRWAFITNRVDNRGTSFKLRTIFTQNFSREFLEYENFGALCARTI